jgi:organic radical activating enzyme
MARKIAFGYATRCNVRCEHCVAAETAGSEQTQTKMSLEQAKKLIRELAAAQVQGISFTAGEPLIYLQDISQLTALCQQFGIYSRVVTNCSWAKNPEQADQYVGLLKKNGLSQLRMSYSRWHQKNIARQNILHAARSCQKNGLDYFISFITDFSEQDDHYEEFLRQHELKFFPEPIIFAGRAESFKQKPLRTDYQANRCPMNPYLGPDLNMYACCDAGSHFTETGFFHLGNICNSSVEYLLQKSEHNPLYNHIRNMGITALASFAGFTAREIIGYKKCELCEKLFNDPVMLAKLEREADTGLNYWYR